MRNSGAQDDGAAQDNDFGDVLDDALTASQQADEGATETEAADAKLTRSIISLFAIVQSNVKTGQQASGDAASLAADAAELASLQAGDAVASDADGQDLLSLLGDVAELDDGKLAALLSGDDAAEQLTMIVAQLQEMDGQVATLETDAQTPVSDDDAQSSIDQDDISIIDMLFADIEEVGTKGAAHHLLAALTKGVNEEGGEDVEAAETAEDGASTSALLSMDQNAAPAAILVKTADAAVTAAASDVDSAKDALAQISSQPHLDKAAIADLNTEDALKSAKTGDELSATGFDQVTVLDSRRYLGFGGDNAKLLTTALASEANRALAPYSTISDVSLQATATTVNTLKIQMNPQHLGTMTASLRLKGEELSVEVTVDTIEGYRHLSKDHSAIVQSLRDQGFSVDQVSIQLNPSPKTESQQQDQGQNGSNQNLREGQGDAQRQQSGDGRTAPRSERLATGDIQASDLDDSRSSGTSDGGLYL